MVVSAIRAPALAAASPRQVEIVILESLKTQALERLRRRLDSNSWPTATADRLGALPQRVSPRHRVVVVVHVVQAGEALAVLKALEEKRHSVFVIVVADRTEPGERYCVMEAGAVAYFEIGEDPEKILRGVEWAARVLAP